MNVKLAAGRINVETLEVIASDLSDPDEAEQVLLAASIIEQLLQPWMAFGADLCRLCGESPADNNQLRTELLDRHIHPPPEAEQLDVTELTAALEHANATVGARNHEIAGLKHDRDRLADQVDELVDQLRKHAA